MPRKTKIEWTANFLASGKVEPGYTSNPIYAVSLADEKRGWHCTKFDESCDNCYAESINKVYGTGLKFSAENNQLVRFVLSDRELAEIRKLDQRLGRAGKKARIFVGDMLDMFQPGIAPSLHAAIWQTVEACPNLQFQILTKLPAQLRRSLEYYFNPGGDSFVILPANLWLGFSAPNQQKFDQRWSVMHELVRYPEFHLPGGIFLSYEPALGPLVLPQTFLNHGKKALVIAGGESGNKKIIRPAHPDWFRSVRDQCVQAGVHFFMKQWGDWKPVCEMSEAEIAGCYHPAPKRRPETASRREKRQSCILHRDGTQEFSFPKGAMQMFRLGKDKTGRQLDGETWNQLPAF